jgi:hypothetical protein
VIITIRFQRTILANVFNIYIYIYMLLYLRLGKTTLNEYLLNQDEVKINMIYHIYHHHYYYILIY